MELLARHWWAPALRGVVAVLFGLMALFSPISAMAVLVILFGAYALVDGILSTLQPPLAIQEFAPFADRDICRVTAG